MLPTVAWAVAIFAASSCAQAVTGFGFALLAVPLLVVVTNPQSAVVSCAIVALALTGAASIHERAHIDRGSVVNVVIPAIVGMPLGLLILKSLPDAALNALVAVVVLISTWIVWRRPKISGGAIVTAAIGLLVGVLTTSTGTNGPPLVATFQSRGLTARQFRATLAAIFAVCGVISVILFASSGEITSRSATLAAAGVPAALIGWWVGDHVFRRISASRFRTIVLAALVVTSAVILVRLFI